MLDYFYGLGRTKRPKPPAKFLPLGPGSTCPEGYIFNPFGNNCVPYIPQTEDAFTALFSGRKVTPRECWRAGGKYVSERGPRGNKQPARCIPRTPQIKHMTGQVVYKGAMEYDLFGQPCPYTVTDDQSGGGWKQHIDKRTGRCRHEYMMNENVLTGGGGGGE